MNRLLSISLVALLALMLCNTRLFAEGSIPSDVTADCPNLHNPSPCPDPPPPGPPGATPPSHGASGDDPTGCPAGGEDPVPGPPTDPKKCDTPPCNSNLRGGRYGGPQRAFWRGGSVLGGFHNASVGGEVGAANRTVNLTRQDFYLEGIAGTPLTISRTYHNLTAAYAASDDGRTMLGPKWHLNYEIHVKPVANDAPDTFVRRPDGGQCILYAVANQPGTWRTNAAQGDDLTLSRTPSNGFKLSTSDPNVWYTFDSTGSLTSLRYRNGNRVVLSYDSNHVLQSASLDHETSDTDNRSLSFEYANITYGSRTRRRLSRVVLQPQNETVAQYAYDSNGMLYQVSDRFGEASERYVNTCSSGSATPLLTSLYTRDLGSQMRLARTYYYDDLHYLIAVHDGGGSPIVSNMTSSWYMATVNQKSGVRQLFVYDFLRNPTEIHTYDSSNTLVRSIYQKFRQDLNWYDTSAMPEWIASAVEGSGYDSQPAGNWVRYEYVAGNDARTWSDASNTARKSVKKVFFPDDMSVEYGYDENFNVTSITRPLGRVQEYSYDSDGNVKSYTDAMGNTSYYFYDVRGQLVREDLPTSSGRQWEYDGHGHVTRVIDAEGRASVYEYDSRDRLTTATSLGVTSRYEYDSHNRLTKSIASPGVVTEYQYDALGRRSKVIDPLNNATEFDYTTTGQLQKITDPMNGELTFTYNANGQRTGVTDQRGKTTNYAYDEFGRVASVTDPLGKVTRYTYTARDCGGCTFGGAGKLETVTRPDDSVTTYLYTKAGRLRHLLFSGTEQNIEIGYDDAGRVWYVCDFRLPLEDFENQYYLYEYDDNDRLTTETYPDGSIIAYSYDALGRRTSMTDPDGNVTEYHYSNTANDKKLAYIEHPFSGRTTFYYSPDKGLLTEEDYGTVQLVATGWQYDALNRVSASSTVNGDTSEVYYGEAHTYNANSMRTRVDYEVSGQPNSHRLYEYDDLYRLTSQHKRWSATNTTAWRYGYQYDAAGNRTQMVRFDGSTTDTATYTYNDINQLTQSSGGGLPYGLNHLYDDNGNLAEVRDDFDQTYYQRHYTHNTENRLVQFTDDVIGDGVTYLYDPMGRRIMRTDAAGNKEKYIYDGLNVLMVREKPGGCTAWRTKRVYTLLESALNDVIAHSDYSYSGCSSQSGPVTTWYLYDLLGNVVAQMNATGNVIATYDQEAYGNVLSGSPAGRHLTGKELDPVSGLYYFGARWYEPGTGRWLQLEPTGADGPNLYWYGLSDPNNVFDPDGRRGLPRHRPPEVTGNPGFVYPNHPTAKGQNNPWRDPAREARIRMQCDGLGMADNLMRHRDDYTLWPPVSPPRWYYPPIPDPKPSSDPAPDGVTNGTLPRAPVPLVPAPTYIGPPDTLCAPRSGL